ncbi:MAG: non-canonical purine NTP pyrophosphatase [Methylobacterium sp.]|jgi:XTP/dITP diphosphohydrolase|nr:non-canonical purine NTP pyrophosphatase [Methylobacterium sp.]MCA3603663.1 non-canonical purine NTP pyrophosphatase [Methylobacterium sp.]MCA3612107.1 non-canonical purine NTP pyrophosphatase [Methylobacterium sp.]MCA3616225.1 non-canonical purine NTP pyrophosphatase [Methylobacterium sp.]MCA4910894.1 non-canonical purine NTP pyrophosphatase [Methylobacterium sp.]
MSAQRLSGRVVIATHNAGKLAEMRDLLEPYGLEIVSAGELGLPEPREDGMMFAENAAIKAHAAAKASGLPAIADDSGLAIDALDGAPGLFTADWAGLPRDWMRAMARVKAELEAREIEMAGAPARFVSALVVAWPDGETLLAEGRCFGHLTWPPRGEAGFGYDPIFVPEGGSRTFSELSREEKHGIREEGGRLTGLSHRARAFIRLIEKAGLKKVSE